MRDESYSELISELVGNFKKTIPDTEEELIVAFEDRLYEAVENLKNSNSKFIPKTKDFISSTIKRIGNDYASYDLETKKQELLVDESFEKIRVISGLAFKMARQTLNGEKADGDLNISKKVEVMQMLLTMVKPYNKSNAENLVSEAILDLEYSNNPNVSAVSLRLSHILRNNGKSKKEEVDI